MSNNLKLVSHGLCPFVQRVAIALLEKNIAFERETIDLANKPEWFLAISPSGKVPLLIVGGEEENQTVLFESFPICEFIEDEYRQVPLHPTVPLKRAKHRAWMEFATAAMGDAWGMINSADKEGFVHKASELRGKLMKLDSALVAGPYFEGAEFSMVDVVMAPIFRFFEVLNSSEQNIVLEGLPRVEAWRQSLMTRPSVRQAVSADYSENLRKFLIVKSAFVVSNCPI
ncbi:glutathione S-transferase [Pseudomonas sp. BR1R-5]|uniref:glutathione S-transferase family protein n=1 Tax=Pseudomonas sp. BR1R-5 TaxID=3003626 RepID=UPI0022C6D08C|nr:glutathione S-transferase family protein [Pseudomonas sp. BR1R-5]GLH32783.1 glutathione S-transferase [Pseudomonas sp. BR1R-5]